MSKKEKPWANFLNEYSKDRYIPWTDSCPYCGKATPLAWNGYIIDVMEIDVWYCPHCESVLNFYVDGPKADITWLTRDEAASKGMKVLDEST